MPGAFDFWDPGRQIRREVHREVLGDYSSPGRRRYSWVRPSTREPPRVSFSEPRQPPRWSSSYFGSMRPSQQGAHRSFSSSSSQVRRRFVTVKALTGSDRGNFNEGVYLVHDKNNPRAFYIEKRIKTKDVQDFHGWREVKALDSCKHRNIVGLIGSELNDLSPGYGSIYMQFCELGSLFACIKNFKQHGRSMSEGFIWSIFFQLSLAICYLQTGCDATEDAREGKQTLPRRDWVPILHRDIKPDNCLITWKDVSSRSGYPTLVLGDFGCSLKKNHAKERREISRHVSRCQPKFTAPETPSYSTTADIYSLGKTMSCVARLTGGPDEHCIAEGRPIPSHYSDDLQGLVGQCIEYDKNRRPRATDLPTYVYQCKKRAERWRGYTSAIPDWAFPR
ncbi:kinase-like domain-containing protein [Lophiotrema nucula]|uniref:non-specific serine/threonine protein kinase n=1 Tax=Lophiotrema nucula TaxID=690887 RepID=A0A6A5ZNM4_9PLEO|nr:kinase-like domain-containing protein [Lophiotrema nucula]